ncbi:hypothetical protein [Acinetobacter baumannii]|uniref:hypothetical protein n=1 Tax=Acinetobacter baumannii TaxID=470 RepID=UPI003F196FA6
MNPITDNAYLIFACKRVSDGDLEADFIIDGIVYVVVAASKANILNLAEKQEEIEVKFPKHKIIMTHRPLFNLIETLDKYERLQAAMIADGDLLDGGPTGRIADAFRWEPKHDGARQRGHC